MTDEPRYTLPDILMEPEAWFAGRCDWYDVWIDYYAFPNRTVVRIVVCDQVTSNSSYLKDAPQHIRDWLNARPEIRMRVQLNGWVWDWRD